MSRATAQGAQVSSSGSSSSNSGRVSTFHLGCPRPRRSPGRGRRRRGAGRRWLCRPAGRRRTAAGRCSSPARPPRTSHGCRGRGSRAPGDSDVRRPPSGSSPRSPSPGGRPRRRYGGRIHPRISPSRTTQNVFLFTTPAGIFDGWTGEHVHFTGEGAAKERIRYPPTATSPSCTIAPKTAPCGCSVARFARSRRCLSWPPKPSTFTWMSIRTPLACFPAPSSNQPRR